ncbi:MAG: SoxR reducing system RseC family protein [Candidatus Accumulibacter phosphatis]|uniref:SoxR reducing system RseC family protein n=2 Tax=Candidatus Accumulibacter TaxID=327159 RepID=A0A7D5SDM2_9PROT|nr:MULTISPECIES: SoxR reducing system RseC family protein [Candidatus Accumulibacter]QLH49802.1 MAG: SoxR reducing system RseC family protein [Candidatus Accumulibacter cognatus]MBL8401096.1 SoxR reducing system RseC family protein [Accumulibacter sp.]MBN8519633.1 SoxR reducing system RseC family protein [Accumulibacter sp.]MBO3709239.1 SoxR reducing system RseC family protein [Accumulibacter sp.]MCC2866394.1 SoxR reducing system RseC family protein [Candidatus Accumulibacter phosphatis]
MTAGPLQARGRVVGVHGDVAEVRIDAASGCHACRARAVCGHGSEQSLRVTALADMAVGDPVLLELDQANFALAMAIGYLLPVVTLLLGAALFSFAGDAAAALGAALGLTTGLFLVRLLHRRLLAGNLQPTVSVTCSSQSFPGESP